MKNMSSKRKPTATWILIGVMMLAIIPLLWLSVSRRINMPKADPNNLSQVAQGRQVYATYCASCHGPNLEGQPDWKVALADGSMPAPPHDTSGHTWHHPDQYLFNVVQQGGQASSPPGYKNAMPAFGSKVSDDEIWAVTAYIKSTWPPETQAAQKARDEESRQK